MSGTHLQFRSVLRRMWQAGSGDIHLACMVPPVDDCLTVLMLVIARQIAYSTLFAITCISGRALPGWVEWRGHHVQLVRCVQNTA